MTQNSVSVQAITVAELPQVLTSGCCCDVLCILIRFQGVGSELVWLFDVDSEQLARRVHVVVTEPVDVVCGVGGEVAAGAVTMLDTLC